MKEDGKVEDISTVQETLGMVEFLGKYITFEKKICEIIERLFL